MCDLSKKLVAWMDGELSESESAALARHVESCPECRECLAAFEQTSNAFKVYCEMAAEKAVVQPFAIVSRRAGRDAKPRRWTAIACGAGALAAAAVLVMLVMQPRRRTVQAPATVAVQSAPPHVAEKPIRAVEVNRVAPPMAMERHNHSQSQVRNTRAAQSIGPPQRPQVAESQASSAFAGAPPIEISVPAEAMFPPGAVPDGISYTAVVTFAADTASRQFGNASVNGLKAGFYRGGNRP